MLKIYHNPRCRKSREGLAILEESGKEFDIVKYLDTPPSYIELAAIIGKLKIEPIPTEKPLFSLTNLMLFDTESRFLSLL